MEIRYSCRRRQLHQHQDIGDGGAEVAGKICENFESQHSEAAEACICRCSDEMRFSYENGAACPRKIFDLDAVATDR